MKPKSIAFLLLTLFFPFSCTQNPSQEQSKIFNPNGDSELALLMRSMFDDGMQVKEDLLARKDTEVKCQYTKVHTASATEPEKVATPEYASFASAYEEAVESFNASTPYNRTDTYQHMINSCIQCHQEVCPGPIRKIKKLVISEKEILRLSGK